MCERHYSKTAGHQEEYQEALAYLKFYPSPKVLDLCCGSGYGSAMLATYAFFVVGVDYSEEAIRYAQLHYPQCTYEIRNLENEPLPFRDGYFDFVVWIEGLEHLSDPTLALSETRRVLKDGGGLFLSMPHSLKHRTKNPYQPFHKHEYTKPELSGFFKGSRVYLGFHSEHPERHHVYLFWRKNIGVCDSSSLPFRPH